MKPCHTLQHIANTLQQIATHCNTLQHTEHIATHCNTLQHTATHCNTLQQFIYTLDMSFDIPTLDIYVWHDTCIHILCAWLDSNTCLHSHACTCDVTHIHVLDMYVWRDFFIRGTKLIRTCAILFTCGRAALLRVTGFDHCGTWLILIPTLKIQRTPLLCVRPLFICVCVCIYIYIWIHIYTYICIYINIYIYIYIYIYVYILYTYRSHVCIYKHIHTFIRGT